jgi:hypothetical protein
MGSLFKLAIMWARGLGLRHSVLAELMTYRAAGHKITAKDVISLVGGGTGFAGREGQKLQSTKKYLLGPGSGQADLRGQAAAGASRFGLAFHN